MGTGVVTHADGREADDRPTFTAIQAQELAVPGSLSNSWADFDNDGDADLAVSIKSGEIRLYRNDKGKLVSVGKAMGLPTGGAELRGLAWGDYDADGWIDLYGGATSTSEKSRLFRNQGGKAFVEMMSQPALIEAGRSSRQSSWVDFDNDGDLDLFAANRNGANALFRHDPAGFRRILAEQPFSDTRPTVGACWFDFDHDSDLDVFLANQAGATDALWRNDGNGFADVAPSLGIDRPGRVQAEGSVGCALADYDNDGDLDLYVASYGHAVLYRNDGQGGFSNAARELGLEEYMHAVGAAWGDYDNDGYIDLFVAAYSGPPGKQSPDNRLYRNLGGKRFVNVLASDSPLNAADHGGQWVDYDQDGALDLSITRGYTDQGGHFVFHNELPTQKRLRSLSVLVTDRDGRRTRMGAEVRLYDRTGRIIGTRQVSTGDGYNSQSSVPVHFGLASDSKVTIEVTYIGPGSRNHVVTKTIDPTRYRGRALLMREDRRSRLSDDPDSSLAGASLQKRTLPLAQHRECQGLMKHLTFKASGIRSSSGCRALTHGKQQAGCLRVVGLV